MNAITYLQFHHLHRSHVGFGAGALPPLGFSDLATECLCMNFPAGDSVCTGAASVGDAGLFCFPLFSWMTGFLDVPMQRASNRLGLPGSP